MPYPYSNSLGKNPPPASVTYKKSPSYYESQNKYKLLEEALAKTDLYQEMLKEHTIKFPGIKPLVTAKDFPGNHPANKYGKSDPFGAEPVTYSYSKEQAESLKKLEEYYASYKPGGKPAPQFLGKIMNLYDPITMSHKVSTKVWIEGLSVDATIFNVSHSISDMAALNMNSDMLSNVLDETFDKMKQEIMQAVIKKAGEK